MSNTRFAKYYKIILNFVVFAKTRVTRRFCAKNAAYSTGLSQMCAISYWLLCGADGRTDDHVTITSLPKFLGSIGNHFFLIHGAQRARLRRSELCYN